MKKQETTNMGIIIQGFQTLPLNYNDSNKKSEPEIYATINGVIVYQSNYNPNIYLIKDPNADFYSAHERQDNVATDIDSDLAKLVNVLYPSVGDKK